MAKSKRKGRPTSREQQRRFPWRETCICAVLVVGTFAVYGQVYRFDFVEYDDPAYVTEEPHVSTGLTIANVIWAFTHVHDANWHPMVLLSHMLDVELWGLNAGGHHLMNVLLHAINAVLLFLVLRRMTDRVWPSALVAGLFALHPLHVESVAWVVERKDTLSTLFWFLALGAYVRWVQQKDRRWYLLLLLFATLGLAAKTMLVTLPALLLLLDYWPLRRLETDERDGGGLAWRRAPVLVLEKAPLFALSLAFCIITMYSQEAVEQELRFSTRLGNALVAYANYVFMMFWPARLAVFYPLRLSGSAPNLALALPAWQVAGSTLFLVGVTALTVWTFRRLPYLFVGWSWYLGTLVPVIGIVQVGSQAMADRYSYVPLIGLSIMAVWGAADVAARVAAPRPLVAGLAAAVMLVLAAASTVQTRCWRDTETLFRHALEATSNNPLVHTFLGIWFVKHQRFAEAEAQFREACDVDPSFHLSRHSLGMLCAQRGRLDEAVTHFKKAIEIAPWHVPSYWGLADALQQLGRNEEALPNLQEAARLAPEDPAAYKTLAMAQIRLQMFKEAEPNLRRAVDLAPGDPSLRQALGLVLLQLGRREEALAYLGGAPPPGLKPDDVQALVNQLQGIRPPDGPGATNTSGPASTPPGPLR